MSCVSLTESEPRMFLLRVDGPTPRLVLHTGRLRSHARQPACLRACVRGPDGAKGVRLDWSAPARGH